VLDISGRPLPFGGMPAGGAQRQVLDNAFFQSQEQAESGGDPFAVSPKGARGPMQIMPQTAAAPGFGMQPLPVGATPDQNRAFGQEYMRRITEQVGGDPRVGLAA
jgi:soluble lytic murein transglycosylase-like protein